MNATDEQKIRVAWHQSIIVRSIGFAFLLLLTAFVVSTIFTTQTIDSIASIAHDKEILNTLEEQLSGIKNEYNLQQKIIQERLEKSIRGKNRNRLSEKLLLEKLQEAVLDIEIDVEKIVVKRLSDQQLSEHKKEPIKWINRSEIRILNFTAVFPKGPLFEKFKQTEAVKQRYQVIGVELDEKIRNSLINAYAIVLFGFFLLLGGTLFVLANRFGKHVQRLISGMNYWATEDRNFRFHRAMPGELNLMAHQFNNMAEQIEINRKKNLYLEKVASWQVIARKLAHEIKNPLTPIQMMVSQMTRQYKGSDEKFGKLLEEAETIISEEIAGLKRMVETFSNFARLPSPIPKDIDLVQISKQILELQRNTFPQHTFDYIGSLEAAPARLDGDLLRQVLLNLTKNAAQACTDPTNIEINVAEDVDGYHLSVIDHGPGIPPEIKSRIFEAYFTTKHTGPSPGMGLGLAICQKIILDHSGEISVQSTKGHTMFLIRLPSEISELENEPNQ